MNTTNVRIKVTPRQKLILVMLADGCTRGEMAERLGVMPGTVSDYIKDLYRRLGVHDARAAVAAARKTGLFQAARTKQ